MSTLPDSEMTPHVRIEQGMILAGQVTASHLPSLTQAASPNPGSFPQPRQPSMGPVAMMPLTQ